MSHTKSIKGRVREMSNGSSTFSMDGTVAEGGKLGRPDEPQTCGYCPQSSYARPIYARHSAEALPARAPESVPQLA